jgi:hypothetical protein
MSESWVDAADKAKRASPRRAGYYSWTTDAALLPPGLAPLADGPDVVVTASHEGSSRCSPVRLTPGRQAKLFEWLALSRECPAELTLVGPAEVPTDALVAASLRGLFGVTSLDLGRAKQQLLLDGNVAGPTRLKVNAYHEAARVVTAMALGRGISCVAITPVPFWFPPELTGHIEIQVQPPQPLDCYLGSPWIDNRLSTFLAGYLLEDLLPSNNVAADGRRHPRGDHARAVAMLSIAAPNEPNRAAGHLRDLRRRTFHLLNEAHNVRLIQVVADQLLTWGCFLLEDFNALFFDGECGASHPDDRSLRCCLPAHDSGDHVVGDGGSTVASPVFPGWHPRARDAASQRGNVKKLWDFECGDHEQRLGKSWTAVHAACNRLDVSPDEYNRSPLRHALLNAFD